MKKTMVKHITFIAIVVGLIVGISTQVNAQQDVKKFISGTDTFISRIGSLLIDDDVGATTASSVITTNPGALDCINKNNADGGESCIDVDGHGVFQKTEFTLPLNVIQKAFSISPNTTLTGLGSQASAFTVGGTILDWSLAYPTTDNSDPRDENTSQRNLCADENGVIIVCTETGVKTAADWDFDFYLDNDPFVTQANFGYAGFMDPTSGSGVSWNSMLGIGPSLYGPSPLYPTGATPILMFEIDNDGDLGDIQCQYSNSPVYYFNTSQAQTTNYGNGLGSLGPRDPANMRWTEVDMDANEYTLSPSTVEVAFNKRASNNTSAPFYKFVSFTGMKIEGGDTQDTNNAQQHGYSTGAVRCRTAETTDNAAGNWKYQVYYPGYGLNHEYDVSDTLSDDITLSRSGNTLSWTQMKNDIKDTPGLYYSVVRNTKDNFGNYFTTVTRDNIVASVKGTSFDAGTHSCDTEYYIVVSNCDPVHTKAIYDASPSSNPPFCRVNQTGNISDSTSGFAARSNKIEFLPGNSC